MKVYNWFANRRKEMKRRANIGEGLGGLRLPSWLVTVETP